MASFSAEEASSFTGSNSFLIEERIEYSGVNL
uniref:Uncharacterized protein n=1 Tax=Siphoviridae sp. ct5FX1 TaxID=2825335 RepID=A0A8S5UPP5_9CAUD|nr:MAG TPA: hypothetical protein [Siphoviridae sp. ct5FX1]